MGKIEKILLNLVCADEQIISGTDRAKLIDKAEAEIKKLVEGKIIKLKKEVDNDWEPDRMKAKEYNQALRVGRCYVAKLFEKSGG